MKPDVVIVTTGAVPLGLSIPGAERDNVLQANDVIKGTAAVKSRVVVVGGSMLGIEVAILLAEQGKEVALVEQFGLGGRKGPSEKRTYRTLVNRLIELRIPLYTSTTAMEIIEHDVIIGMGQEVFSLPADTVVLAIGAEPVNRLVQELEGAVPQVYAIGDCVEPSDAAEATYMAAGLALEI